MSSLRGINIKNHTLHFFGDIINIKNPDLNHIKIDEEQCENILLDCAGNVTITMCKTFIPFYQKNKSNEYIKDINGFKYLTLMPTNESKQTLKRYG